MANLKALIGKTLQGSVNKRASERRNMQSLIRYLFSFAPVSC